MGQYVYYANDDELNAIAQRAYAQMQSGQNVNVVAKPRPNPAMEIASAYGKKRAIDALTPSIKASIPSLGSTVTPAGFADAGGGYMSFGDVPALDTFSETGAGVGVSDVAGAAAAIHGGYNTAQNIWGKRGRKASAMSGAETGAGIGTMILPGWGTAIGAGVGAIGGALIGNLRSGKSQAQQMRDEERKALKEIGLYNKDNTVTLADGSTFDIGKDGHAKLSNKGGGNRAYYNTDTSDPTTGQAIGWAQPLAAIGLGTGSGKAKDDQTGYITNAIQSNANGDFEAIRQNALALMGKMGLTQSTAIQRLDQLRKAGRITDAEYGAYVNGINTMISGSKKYQTTEEINKAIQSGAESGAPGGATPLPRPIVPQIKIDAGNRQSALLDKAGEMQARSQGAGDKVTSALMAMRVK